MLKEAPQIVFRFRASSQKNYDYLRKIYLLLREDFNDFQKAIVGVSDQNLDPNLNNFLSDVYVKYSEINEIAKALNDRYQDEILNFDKVISDYQNFSK